MGNGKFIVFEGCDGCGKSTLLENFKEYLEKQGYDVISTREPGGTDVGEEIRDIIMKHDNLSSTTECMLFGAARQELINQVILPALLENKIVLCDRYYYSNIVYQSMKAMNMYNIKSLNEQYLNLIYPNYVFYLDIDPDVAKYRMKNRVDNTRFDNYDLDYHRRCRIKYNGIMDEIERDSKITKVCRIDSTTNNEIEVLSKAISFFKLNEDTHGGNYEQPTTDNC